MKKEGDDVMHSKKLYMTCFALVIFGALDMGVYGITNVDVIEFLFGANLPYVADAINTLIGAAGVYLLYTRCACNHKACNKD